MDNERNRFKVIQEKLQKPDFDIDQFIKNKINDPRGKPSGYSMDFFDYLSFYENPGFQTFLLTPTQASRNSLD